MKKERYLSPFTRVVTMLESHGVVCTSIDEKKLVKVDPWDEIYNDGTEAKADYLIELK